MALPKMTGIEKDVASLDRAFATLTPAAQKRAAELFKALFSHLRGDDPALKEMSSGPFGQALTDLLVGNAIGFMRSAEKMGEKLIRAAQTYAPSMRAALERAGLKL